MDRATWRDVELDTALQMRASGQSVEQIAVSLGRSAHSVASKFQRYDRQNPTQKKSQPGNAKPVLPSVPQAQSQDLRREAEQMRNALYEVQQEKDFARSKAGVVGELDEQLDESEPLEQVWDRHADQADKKIAAAFKKSRFSQSFDEGPIAISFISDQHIAPGTACDFRRMREDAMLIRETPGLYACLAGDGVDNHVKIRSAVLGARSTPDEQWELFDYYLGLFAEKILVVCSGNHDAWTVQFSGADMLKVIAQANRVRYCPAEARITVKVEDQIYSLAFRHQYRYNSNFNQTHCVKQWFRMGEEPFDVGVIGHHHEAAIEAFLAQGSVRWAARPGSYQITTPYSDQYGFNKAKPTCPTFILFGGEEKRIIGFWDVRDAVIMLKALRGRK